MARKFFVGGNFKMYVGRAAAAQGYPAMAGHAKPRVGAPES